MPADGLPPGVAAPPSVMWPTKAELLKATRQGAFKGLPEIRVDMERDLMPLTVSVVYILEREYGVPKIQGRPLEYRTCLGEVHHNAGRVLRTITEMHLGTLSDQPPTYYREFNAESSVSTLTMQLAQMGRDSCQVKVLGSVQPHPFVAALKSLANEFGIATKDYVQDERKRRMTAYQAQQEEAARRRREAAAERERLEADARAAEQRRQDEERARTAADEKRRQELERRRQEEERARAEADEKKRLEQERKRQEEERARAEAEEKRRQELERKRVGG